MMEKKLADQAFRKVVVREARGKGIEWRIHRRLWWHRMLSELRDELEKRIDYIKRLVLRDFRKLDLDGDRDSEITGWTEDRFVLNNEDEARRFQRVIRKLLGPEWSEKAVVSEQVTTYRVSPGMRKYLKDNRSIRKETMKQMGFKPVLRTRRRVQRAIKDKPRRGDLSREL